MTVRRSAAGSGITRRAALWLMGDATDMGDTLRHASSSANFESWICEPETEARAILEKSAPTAPENDEPADFAQRIVRIIQLARGAIDRGDAAGAAHFAVMLGHTVASAEMKAAFERDAARGWKVLASAHKGGPGKKGLHGVRDRGLALDLRKRMAAARTAGGGISRLALIDRMLTERLRPPQKPPPHSLNGLIKAIARGEAILNGKTTYPA